MFLKTLISCIVKSLAAPLAWLMVGLLRGEHLTCALWPTNGDIPVFIEPECEHDGKFPLPCQIPKTYENPILPDDCPSVYSKFRFIPSNNRFLDSCSKFT